VEYKILLNLEVKKIRIKHDIE